jgi:dTDP-L-rhamnose 4-epimerase
VDQVFNVGSGRNFSVLEIAAHLVEILHKDVEPEITQSYRVGDIRHCFADITRARDALGYRPEVTFEQGLAELAEWLEGQIVVNHFDDARHELASRGLTV